MVSSRATATRRVAGLHEAGYDSSAVASPEDAPWRFRMKRIVLFSGLVLFPLTPLLLLQPLHAATPSSVTAAARHDVSAALRDMASGKGNAQGPSQEMPEPRPTRAPFSSGTSDPVAQQIGGVLPGVP